MGSEVIIIGYSVLAFLSIYAFKAISGDERNIVVNASNPIEGSKSLEKIFDPITFAFKLIFLATFFISILGIGKGVYESYDYCYLTTN